MRQNKIVMEGDRNAQLSSEANIYASMTTAHSNELSKGVNSPHNPIEQKINTSSSAAMSLGMVENSSSVKVMKGDLINMID